MPAKKTIAEQVDARCRTASVDNVVFWARRLRTEYQLGDVLTQPEVVALAKKIINRAFDADFTRAEVEEFLRS